MRFPGTLSARITIGFTVLIVTFGGISALTVANMVQLNRAIRAIRIGYLRLALKTRDLAEKQATLSAYLRDELESETSPRQVERRVRRLLAARERLLEQTDEILDQVRDLPKVHQKSMRATALRVGEIRELVSATKALYKRLLEAPPVERGSPETASLSPLGQTGLSAAAGALKSLQRQETRIHNLTQRLQSYQRNLVEETARSLERGSEKLRLVTIYSGAAAVLVGLLIAVWGSLTLRPLRRLHDAAQRIARGEYQERIEERGPREVADLAREFNIMGAAIEEREHELVRTERLATVGKMAAMITHEVRNPLSSIGLNTELLEDELSAVPEAEAAEARSLCRAITTEVDRLTAITEQYLQFARLPKPKVQEEAVNPIVENLADFEREQLSVRGVKLRLDLASDLPAAVVDDSQIRQALLNLLRNAAEAVEEEGGGSVSLSTRRGAREGTVEIVVRDDGSGISEELLPKLFDPFVSTKKGGTGLGLALTQQIVHEHGGRIEVSSTPGEGTTFVVALPTVGA